MTIKNLEVAKETTGRCVDYSKKIYAINQTEISLLRKITQLQAEIIEEYKKQEMENLHQKEWQFKKKKRREIHSLTK